MEGRKQTKLCQWNDAIQTGIEQESQTSDFGDERLDERFGVIMDRFSRKLSPRIPAAGDGWSEMVAVTSALNSIVWFGPGFVRLGDAQRPCRFFLEAAKFGVVGPLLLSPLHRLIVTGSGLLGVADSRRLV